MNRRGLFAFFALTPVMAVEAIAKPPEPPKPKIEGAPFDGQFALTLTANKKATESKPTSGSHLVSNGLGNYSFEINQPDPTKAVKMAVGEDGNLWLKSKDGEWKRVVTET